MDSTAPIDRKCSTAIRRIGDGRGRWRVLVESWQERDIYRGRLLFRSDSAERSSMERESAALLSGRSHEDVLSLAYELPDERLRRVLRSLG